MLYSYFFSCAHSVTLSSVFTFFPFTPQILFFTIEDFVVLPFQTINGLSEESSTERLEFPLLTQRSLNSITQLLPFLRTLCCSFKGPPPGSQTPPHLPVADYPAASPHAVLKRLEVIIEEEFLDTMES